MRTPFASVIVPVFNLTHEIYEALVSIAEQDERRFECLVVDDASTDGSRELIHSFCAQDDRFRVIQRTQHEGASAARNAALAEAVGEFVLFVDGDDRLRSHALTTLIDAALSDDADVVRASHLFWFPTKTPSLRPNVREEINHTEIHGFSYRDCPSAVFAYNCWNTLFRRDFLAATGARFDTMLRIGEDRLFNLTVYPQARRLTFLKEYTYHWRRDRGSSATASLLSTRSRGEADLRGELLRQNILTLDCIDRHLGNLPRHAEWLRAAMFFDFVHFVLAPIQDWRKVSEEIRPSILEILERINLPERALDYYFAKGRQDDYELKYRQFHDAYYGKGDIVRAISVVQK